MISSQRELVLPVYLPTAMLSFGQGLMVPIIPLYAKQFGGSYGMAGLVVSAAWMGTMLTDLPAGLLLQRLGFRRSMVLGALLFSVATIALGLATMTPELVGFRFVVGIGTAFWGLSRHTYIAQGVPAHNRGRAISIFGGINRLGNFIGPFVGGVVALHYSLSTALIVAGLVAFGAVIAAFLFVHDPAPEEQSARPRASGHRLDFGVLREVLSHNPRDVLAAGSANILGQMIRAGRQLVIPLFAAYAIGLNPAQVGEIVSVSALVDVTLFIPSGYLMDRIGRKAAAVPSFAFMALGMGLVPFTHSYHQLLLAGLVIGFGNGLGAGTMMTLGADLAPPRRTAEFLGVWRMIGDTGQALAPLVVGGVADIIGIVLTAGVVAGLGGLAAGTLALVVRETRWDHEPRPVRRSAGQVLLRRPPIPVERTPDSSSNTD